MKTIIARFEDMKKDPMAILEDGVSANKVEAALATIGIALRDSEGEFRALQDVMDELGIKWETLTRNQQAYIATVAAGSRQQSRFLAMMNNYDRTLDLIAESQNSAGAAAKQYATYQDSIAAAQARLTASWENFYSKIVDNDLIKTAINGLSKIIDLLAKIPPSITAIGITIGALQLQKYLTDNRGITGILKKMLLGDDLQKQAKTSAIGYIETFSTTSFSELRKKMPTIIGGFKSLGKNIGTALSSITSGFIGVGNAIAAFVAANWEIVAIAAVVGGAIAGINYLLNTQKREYKEATERIQKYNEEYENLTNKTNSAKNLLDIYEDLSKKISLTDEEQTTLNNTIDELKDLYPELITATNNYGEAEIANIKVLKDRIMAEEKLAKIQKQKALESQRDILAKNTKEWNQDDIAQISAKYAAQFFNAKDDLERAQQYTKNIPTAKQKKMRVNWYQGSASNSANVLDFVNNKIYEQVESRYQNDVLKQSKEALNTMIDFYGLSNQISKLDMTKGWEDVYDVAQRLSNIVKDAPIKIAEANKQMVDAKKNLEKINYLDLGFNNLNFSDNSSIYTSQKLVEDQIRSMFDQMDLDIWSRFLNINDIDPKDSTEFSNFIQEMLDVVTEENSIDITQLFKDFNSGKITNIEFFDGFLDLAKQSGNSSAIAFANSFYEVLGKQLDKEKEKYKDYLISLGLGEDYATLQSEKITKIGQGQKRQDYIEEYLNKDDFFQLTSFNKIPTEALQDLEVQVAEAIKDGNLDGLESLPDVWAEKWGIMDNMAADIISYGATADAIEKMIEERANIAFENIGKIASQIFSKKDFSSVGVDEAVDYMGAFGGADNFLKHAKMGDDGKFEIDVYGQRLMLQKQLNDQIAIYDGYINDIEKLGEDITLKEKKQLEYWRNLREEAAKQKITIGDIVDLTEDIKRTVSEIELPEITGGGIASENAKALDVSIDIGKEYENIINLADKLEKQMKDIGHVDDDIVKELLSYGSVFEDFFVVQDDGTIEMQLQSMVDKYGSAAEAIKDIANKKRLAELEIKKQEMLDEADYSEKKAEAYEQMALIMRQYVQSAIDNEKSLTIGERREKEQQALDQINSISTSLSNVEAGYTAYQGAAEIMYENLEKYDIAYWNSLGPDNIAGTMQAEFKKAAAITASATLNPLQLIINKDREGLLEGAKTYEQAAKGLREYAARLRAGADKLKIIDPTVYEKLADKMEEAGKAGEKAGETIAKAIADAAEAIIKLNELVKDLQETLNDISIDISPFTDIFEEWEHEWDYFFNIKTKLSNINRSRNMFTRISGAEWASPQERIEADRAILGTYLQETGFRQKYAEGLMAAIVQKGTDMTEKYGQFGTFDLDTMTWYQKDDQLVKINEEQGKRVENINNLQEEQWKKQNEQAMAEAELEALEAKKDAHQEILDELKSQLETLQDSDEVEADTSAIEERIKAEEEAIATTEEEINTQKDLLDQLAEELKKIDFDLWAEQDAYDFWDKYVSDMESDISDLNSMITEYYDNVDAMIDAADALWEKAQDYKQTAIDTENQLRDAIIENYQKEIDAKKKQYDYLKQLDNDYLDSIKKNIDEERKARTQSGKQKSYEKNLQRAQLLQMDTSGLYRSELASLGKEIENQRQELYDDLVDKQVEALEKEIEKRHELYDKEVQALEERLAYMQENASLLWEMVNGVISEGTGSMMALLETTNSYISANELEQQEKRKNWEVAVEKTVTTATTNNVASWELMAKIVGKIAKETYPNYQKEVKDNTKVLGDAETAISNYTKSLINGATSLSTGLGGIISSISTNLSDITDIFVDIMNGYTKDWANATSTFTGNVGVFGSAINQMISSYSTNVKTLNEWNSGLSTSGGKIIKTIDYYNDELAKKYADIYNAYEEERNRYKNELESLINSISTEIANAAGDAANAIRKAVDSLQNIGKSSGENNNPNPNSNPNPNPSPNPGGEGEGNTEEQLYSIHVEDWEGNEYNSSEGDIYKTAQEWNDLIMKARSLNGEYYLPGIPIKYKNWKGSELWKKYLMGGLADYTGPAWLDGTKSKPERILSPRQTKLFESLVSSLERTANNSNVNSVLGSSYNIGDINTTIQVEKLDNNTDIEKVAQQVENRIMRSIKNRTSISIK